MSSTLIVLSVVSLAMLALIILAVAFVKPLGQQTMHDFSRLLEQGRSTPGDGKRGPRALGRWKGREVSVCVLARLDPPVVLTVVEALRRPSPFAMLMVPRENRSAPPLQRPFNAPRWMASLDRVFDIQCAPEELLGVSLDDVTAASLSRLVETEVEVLPGNINIQRRDRLREAADLLPLLDAAVALANRLDAIHSELVGPSEPESARRAATVGTFLSTFQQ
jgi:hypothetical protein